MNQYQVSLTARSDLDEIWFYIAQDNPEAADKLVTAITAKFPTLATWPGIGRQREELADRLRSLSIGRYVIFYRPMENGIEVVRILHGARDLPPLFE